jgi:hypothetical protein
VTGDTHYNLEILAELAEGLLDDATARQVRGHLAICDPCGERLADLAAVREVLAAIPVPAMPMGVALRVDRAIAAEAERSHNGALRLDEAPDWDRIMRDAPWETEAPLKESPVVAPVRQVPAERPDLVPVGASSLGIVLDDGSVVPARPLKTSRKRRWLAPISAAAAAAAVVGSAGVAISLLASGGGGSQHATIDGPIAAPTKSHASATAAATAAAEYPVGDSGYFYADAELKGPLVGYFGPQPGAGGTASADPKLDRCIQKVAKLVGSTPIGVDRAYYNGNEAAIMVFWHNKVANSVQVRVVNSDCKNMRKPGLARWN